MTNMMNNKNFDFGRKYTEDELDSIYQKFDDDFITVGWVLPNIDSAGRFPFKNLWEQVLFAKGTTEGEVIVPPEFVSWEEEYDDVTLSDVLATKGQIESKYDFRFFYTVLRSSKSKIYREFLKKEDKKLAYYQQVYAFVKRNPDFQDIDKIENIFGLYRN